MKKNIFISLISLILFSCGNGENLNKKIIELEVKNRKLKDSLIKMKKDAILNLKLDLTFQKINKNLKIDARFVQFSKLPKHNVYSISNSNQKKLIAQNLTNPDFQYDLQSSSLKMDSIIDIVVEFDVNGSKIVQYGRLNFKNGK